MHAMGSSKRKKEEMDEEEIEGPAKKRKTEESGTATEPAEPLEPQNEVSRGKGEGEEEFDSLQLLVSAFSNSQQDQYEIYRRSTFPKAAIKKIMQSMVVGSSVPQNAVIAMAGIAKVYVGELVEEACAARETNREEGPLQPKHVREAVRRLKNNNKVPNSRYKKVFPFR